MDIRQPLLTNGGDWVAQFGELWNAQASQLKDRFGETVESIHMPPAAMTDVPIFFIKKEQICGVLEFVKKEPNFQYGFLADITASDEEADPRFHVIYNLFSHQSKSRIRFKLSVADGEEVPTVTSVWKGADWAEREIFDMFGIVFKGHPNLRRILMDSRWQGHPLRKDYPLKAYQIFTEPEPVDSSRLV